MKSLFAALLMSLCYLTANTQDSYYDFIEPGKYKIGYCDSIIYDSEIQYNQYGYRGKAPIFVQIWFPSTRGSDQNYLRLGDYRSETLPEELTEVFRALSEQMDESYINYGIAYDIISDEPIDYGHLTTNEILDRIKLIQTRSTRLKLESGLDYPVIVYHHGSQGMSDENSIMAEYFASRGYIFVSTNFHLPYPNTTYGLLPYELEKENKHNQSSAKTVINFAKSISPNNHVFFIGHSWGAQEGWCFLNDSSWVSAFVSMETTIEFKTDSVKIKEMWPYVYYAIKTQRNKFSIPILLFAATEEDKPFDFFRGVSSKEMIHASYKAPFAHNSYTSFYMMRYFLRTEFEQPDSGVLLRQIKGYAAHLDLIHAFFMHVCKKEELNRADFQELFYLN